MSNEIGVAIYAAINKNEKVCECGPGAERCKIAEESLCSC